MKRQEKDAIINRLLFVTIFSVFASILLWFIYTGYIHTGYVLAMPKIMIAISFVSLITAGLLYWKAKSDKKLFKKLLPYIIISVIIAVGSVTVYFYVLYAIYALWILIAVYLIITFAYNLYKLNIN